MGFLGLRPKVEAKADTPTPWTIDLPQALTPHGSGTRRPCQKPLEPNISKYQMNIDEHRWTCVCAAIVWLRCSESCYLGTPKNWRVSSWLPIPAWPHGRAKRDENWVCWGTVNCIVMDSYYLNLNHHSFKLIKPYLDIFGSLILI